MAFCTSCGANVTGAYCPQCGKPAGGAAGSAPARRRTSPFVWILVALLGLFVIGGIIVFAGGVLLVHKAREAGVDADLMRTNPGLAITKLIAAAHPDVDVVTTDDGAGTITVRDKKTGKVVTMTFDEARHGNFKFDAEDGDGKQAHMEINGPAGKIAADIPVYPGAKLEGNFSVTGDGGGGTGSAYQYTFSTPDSGRKVMSFYHNKLEDAGMKLSLTTNTADGGMIVAEDDARGQTVNVIVEGGSGGSTSIRVTMRVKK
ncbi:MAG: hypothetical protein C5B51_20300 [Terriglobia bacterium]|nr:MAG: hypothetical protein C5B51_20300 [Terriglobia bacterium]